MSKLKFNDLISILRDNYQINKSYYETLFSVLYFTDEDFISEDFLKRRIKYKKEKKINPNLEQDIIHNKYVYTMNVFKNIFGKEFIKSKPLSFLDAFIVCCGDKTKTHSSNDVKKILRKKLLTDFDTKQLYKEYEYRIRSGFTKKKLRAFFENYNKSLEKEDDPLLIRFLCDYFSMNICIILPEIKDILFYSPKDKYSIYFPTIVFEKYKTDQYQYLIMTNKETILNSSTSIIYKLLNYKVRKDFINYVENNNIYIKNVKKKSVNSHFLEERNKLDKQKKFSINEEKKSSNIEKKTVKYNKTKLNKLKLKELQEIAKKCNIDVQKLKVGKVKGFKNKTKKELISEIINQ